MAARGRRDVPRALGGDVNDFATRDWLRVVHLSDIHFKQDSGGQYDLEGDIRNELELDLDRVVADIGQVDAVVVTGDIGYGGDWREYEAAGRWFQRLETKLGISPECFYFVPGNHDVDRARARVPMVRSMQTALRSRAIDIESIAADPRSYAALLEPFESYNDFAASFDCDLSASRAAWVSEIAVPGGVRLRIVGLNSAVVCSEADDHSPRQLVMGPVQSFVPRKAGVAYMTLAHHPPDWLLDGDDFEQILDRVTLQLFGHKHQVSVKRIENGLRVVAGATQPSRREPNWLPRYNLLELRGAVGDPGSLVVRTHRRVWSSEQTKFGLEAFDGQHFREDHLPLPFRVGEDTPPVVVSNSNVSFSDQSKPTPSVEESAQSAPSANLDDPIAPFGEEVSSPPVIGYRQAVRLFLERPIGIRIEILAELGVAERDELRKLSRDHQWGPVLRRVRRDPERLEQLIKILDERSG